MAPREAPSVDDVVETLLEASNGRLKRDRAIRWEEAVLVIKRGFRTVRAKAEDWLTDALHQPNGELVGFYNSGRIYSRTEETVADWGYPSNAWMDILFTVDGARTRKAQLAHNSRYPWVIRRATLVAILDLIREEQAEDRRLAAEEARRTRDQFIENHGDALVVIEQALAPLRAKSRHGSVVTISNFDMSEFYPGPPGSVEIKLYGDEIARFAELCKRATTNAEGTAQ